MPAVNADAGADGNAVKYPRTLSGRAAYDKYAQANTYGNPSSPGNAKTANRNPAPHCETEANRPSC